MINTSHKFTFLTYNIVDNQNEKVTMKTKRNRYKWIDFKHKTVYKI